MDLRERLLRGVPPELLGKSRVAIEDVRDVEIEGLSRPFSQREFECPSPYQRMDDIFCCKARMRGRAGAHGFCEEHAPGASKTDSR